MLEISQFKREPMVHTLAHCLGAEELRNPEMHASSLLSGMESILRTNSYLLNLHAHLLDGCCSQKYLLLLQSSLRPLSNGALSQLAQPPHIVRTTVQVFSHLKAHGRRHEEARGQLTLQFFEGKN